jgi:hypothetical protein
MIDEEVSVYEKVKDKDVDVGDTIEVISNNQEGYRKYKVINDLGKKGLKLINSYDDFMGGRKKTRRHRRKSSKRKSSKRKSSKRKSSKRKNRSHKRK